MKYILIIFLLFIFCLPAGAQKLVAAKPARLQIFVQKTDGGDLMMNSETLFVSYDQLKMTGELMFNTLTTENELLRNLLDSVLYDRITFSGLVPEGKFVFQNTLNEKFIVETDIVYGDHQSRILINYNVSNRVTSSSNAFEISCTGSISLHDDLGVTHETGLQDKISFQFFQNVSSRQY